jgi:ABC-2 type transport system ATP-binding protein
MIEIDGLTKRYGAHSAVNGVTFTVRPGIVTGFVGPNGAGKSTTMRMVCGLTRATAGGATVLGVPYAEIPNPGTQVGVLLDASAQHPGRSGREVLTLSAMLMGLDMHRVDEMLDLVGLTTTAARRRVGTYSLGMRQRLGIANALIGNPRVLILDEPANGLDPAGINWMRRLLREFADRGGTALLSSHLLREVEVIADELVVIDHGRIVAQGSKAQLLSGSGTLVRGADTESLASALKTAELSYSGDPRSNGFIVDAEPRAVGEAAAAGGIVLTELRVADGGGLEELFLRLTAEDTRDEVLS